MHKTVTWNDISKLKQIRKGAFEKCEKLKSVIFKNADNIEIDIEDCFDYSKNDLIFTIELNNCINKYNNELLFY